MEFNIHYTLRKLSQNEVYDQGNLGEIKMLLES